MRILVLFLDMVRGNLLKNSELYEYLQNFKGTLYSNVFSPAPDTGRGIGVFLSGKSPYENGCDNRVKYPKFFLKDKTIFDYFEGYKKTFFLHQHNIIPEKKDYEMFFDISLTKFCENLKLEDNHLLFLDIPTYHSVLDNFGYSKKGYQKANKELVKDLETFFQYFPKDEFDEIFIFSDHGFKFSYEMLYQKLFNKKFLLLNEDRTNILFFHHKKGDNEFIINQNLGSLTDMFYLIKSSLNNKNYIINRDYIVIEDHYTFLQQYTNLEIYSVVMKEKIYIRIYKKGYLLDRKTRNIIETINKNFDEILINESFHFREMYQIEQAKQTSNSNNLCVRNSKRCKARSKFLKNIDLLQDVIINWRLYFGNIL